MGGRYSTEYSSGEYAYNSDKSYDTYAPKELTHEQTSDYMYNQSYLSDTHPLVDYSYADSYAYGYAYNNDYSNDYSYSYAYSNDYSYEYSYNQDSYQLYSLYT